VSRVKPKNEEQASKNVVYKIPCSYGKSYFGQTSRAVKIRLKEHMKKVNKKEVYGSKICDHVLDTGHKMKWDDTTLLYKEPNWRKRNIVEAIFMGMAQDPLSQPSVEISPVYFETLRK